MKENEIFMIHILFQSLTKTITQSIFQYAILQQQLRAQLNSQLLHATSFAIFDPIFNQRHFQRIHSCVWWATGLSFQRRPNTEVHWVEIRRWRRPQFLAPKPRKIVSAPSLGFVGGVRGIPVLLEGEIFIFEVLFHFRQGRGQNVINVHICVDFGTLVHKN